MKYGLSIPNFGPFFDIRLTSQLAYEAEQAGWDGFFIWDHIVWSRENSPVADPWILLTAIAMRTNSMKFGPLVTPLARRRPWKLARETTTLDHLSQGRFILGVGLGSGRKVEYDNLGEVSDPHTRAEILDEGLEILTGLWSGKPFTLHGKHFDIEDACFLPPSYQQPRIPIWVAGNWPHRAPIRRSAHWDGVFPFISDEKPISADEIRTIRALVNKERTLTSPFDILAAGWTQGGTSQQDKDQLLPLEEAGVTWFIEHCDPWHYDFEQTRRRIHLGPPRI